MPSPRAGVEVRHYAERLARDSLDARSHAIANHELWRGTIRVQEEIGFWQEFSFEAIGCAPVNKESSLIFKARAFLEFVCAKI